MSMRKLVRLEGKNGADQARDALDEVIDDISMQTTCPYVLAIVGITQTGDSEVTYVVRMLMSEEVDEAKGWKIVEVAVRKELEKLNQ